MAIATTREASSHGILEARPVCPVSLASEWDWAINAAAGFAATGLDAADNSGNHITNPATQITRDTIRILRRTRGTLLRLMAGYDAAAATFTTQPVVQVFGRANDQEPWQALRNADGETDIEITAAVATDPIGAAPAVGISSTTAVRWTVPGLTKHTIDCDGCAEILIGVKTAHVHDGNEQLSLLLGKFI